MAQKVQSITGLPNVLIAIVGEYTSLQAEWMVDWMKTIDITFANIASIDRIINVYKDEDKKVHKVTLKQKFGGIFFRQKVVKENGIKARLYQYNCLLKKIEIMLSWQEMSEEKNETTRIQKRLEEIAKKYPIST